MKVEGMRRRPGERFWSEGHSCRNDTYELAKSVCNREIGPCEWGSSGICEEARRRGMYFVRIAGYRLSGMPAFGSDDVYKVIRRK
jgi:hypothetical protein